MTTLLTGPLPFATAIVALLLQGSTSDPAPAPAPSPTLSPGALPVSARPSAPDPEDAKAVVDESLPPTRFALDVLAGEPLLVEATTLTVTPFGIGTAVVKVRLDERLLDEGHDVGDELLVFAYVGDFVAHGRNLLLLEPFRDGGRFRVRMRVDARDPDYGHKLFMSRRQVELMNVQSAVLRNAATVDLLLRSLTHASTWQRAYALRELVWIARERPDVLDASRLRRLALLGINSPHPEVRRGVESVAIILAKPDDSLLTDTDGQSSTP